MQRIGQLRSADGSDSWSTKTNGSIKNKKQKQKQMAPAPEKDYPHDRPKAARLHALIILNCCVFIPPKFGLC